MANQLKVATVHSIQTLRDRGWSQRRIARTLGIHRETVGRYLQLGGASCGPPGDDSKPAKPAHGSDEGGDVPQPGSDQDPKPAKPAHGSGPLSRCEPFREIVIAGLEQGLSYQRIWQDLRFDHGFAGSYYSVKRFARRLSQTSLHPFRRMEAAPGEQAQVDFGKGAPVIIPDGEPLPVGVKTRRRKTHLFRIVLSHSRKAYSEVTSRQTTEDFIRCLENAFQHFGGVPKVLVVDNLKAAVLQPDWYDPDLNPKLAAFAAHYGTVILPTKPRTPRHKGKIERQVGYAQDNGLKGRNFSSLAEENAYLLDWETRVADTRLHGTTKRQIRKVFEEVDRPALSPPPLERFPFFHEAQRVVSRDAHVEVDKAFYSVPPQYLGRTVWVRWDAGMVRVFDQRMQQVAVHAKSEPGRFRTHPEHIALEKISGVERGAAYLLRKVGVIGAQAERWATSMLQVRGIQGVRVLQGLISLGERHPWSEVDQACEIAQTHGTYRLRILRTLLKRSAPKQEQFEFIDTHPIIRQLSDYGDLVRRSFQEACL